MSRLSAQRRPGQSYGLTSTELDDSASFGCISNNAHGGADEYNRYLLAAAR